MPLPLNEIAIVRTFFQQKTINICLWVACLGPHAFYGLVALDLIALLMGLLPSWGLMPVGLLPGSHALVPMVLLPRWSLMPVVCCLGSHILVPMVLINTLAIQKCLVFVEITTQNVKRIWTLWKGHNGLLYFMKISFLLNDSIQRLFCELFLWNCTDLASKSLLSTIIGFLLLRTVSITGEEASIAIYLSISHIYTCLHQ